LKILLEQSKQQVLNWLLNVKSFDLLSGLSIKLKENLPIKSVLPQILETLKSEEGFNVNISIFWLIDKLFCGKLSNFTYSVTIVTEIYVKLRKFTISIFLN
jgi:hypothetical protein